MRPQAIIFDIDGTLWDTTGLVAIGYNRHLESQGLSHLAVTPTQLKGLFGKTMQEIADNLLATLPAEERYPMLEGCMAQEHAVLTEDPCDVAFPGIVETLRALAEKYPLYIVSNSEQGYPELTMGKLGIEDLIRDHLCYGDTKAHKGVTIRLLMERNGITDAVYVGDTQGDLEASRMAGVPFVFCRYGFGSPESWDAAVDSPAELKELFL